MKLLGVLTIITIVCAAICGLWMRANPGQGSVTFHAGLSLTAMGLAVLTILLYMLKK